MCAFIVCYVPDTAEHLVLRMSFNTTTRSHDSQARRTDPTNKRRGGILCHMP